MYSVPFHVTHCKGIYAPALFQTKFATTFEGPFVSVASYLAPRSGILQKEGNVLAGLQTSRVRSVLGGELMSIVSSIVVKLTVGPY